MNILFNSKLLKIIVVLIIVMLAVVGCGTKDLTKGKKPNEILTASAEAMQGIKNYTMDFVINSNIGSDQIKPMMTAKAKYQLDPMTMHMDGKMSIMGQELNMTIYMETQENEFVEYIKNPMSNEWMYLSIPLTPEMKDMFIDPQASIKIMNESLKEAIEAGTEKIGEVEHVILEVTSSPDLMTKFYSQMNDPNLNNPQMKDIFKTMGDMKYKVWISKENLYMSKMFMDMSPIFQSILNTMPPDTPEEIKSQFSNIKMTMDATMKDFGKLEPIVIPEDVKKNAVKMPVGQLSN